jgi:hypothetical protein
MLEPRRYPVAELGFLLLQQQDPVDKLSFLLLDDEIRLVSSASSSPGNEIRWQKPCKCAPLS